jgi:ribosomal protein S18 acetylase RimI-like enzyme
MIIVQIPHPYHLCNLMVDERIQMNENLETKILDITDDIEYEKYLYKCLAPMPFRKYRKRHEYLKAAIPKGFHKKLLILDSEVVGQIEYAPADASYYPITGEKTIVMNCIWVLRKAKGHNIGEKLMTDMMRSEKKANGFATVALENHWSPWLKKNQMENLGFKSIDSLKVKHKLKHKGECFRINLMWLPRTANANPPTWDRTKLLEGVNCCTAHPLYHPESLKSREILENKL